MLRGRNLYAKTPNASKKGDLWVLSPQKKKVYDLLGTYNIGLTHDTLKV